MIPVRGKIVTLGLVASTLTTIMTISGCGEPEPPKFIDTTTEAKMPVGGPAQVKVQPKRVK